LEVTNGVISHKRGHIYIIDKKQLRIFFLLDGTEVESGVPRSLLSRY